jgi:hypothetical protein
MAKKIPYCNPIRFRPYSNRITGLIDDDMPRVDKMANQVQYYKGKYPIPYYTSIWKINEEIQIQIHSDDISAIPQDIFLYTPSGILTIADIDITPTGWVGDNVYIYKYTPTVEGEYYFKTVYSDNVDWISDVFTVRENEEDLVEIKYSDSENGYNGLFYDSDGNQLWSPKTYFTGIVMPTKANVKYTIYTNEYETPTKTRATSQKAIKVDLTDITTNYYSQLTDITSCDTIEVNGQPVQNIEPFDSDEFEKSDGMDVSMDMIKIESDNYVKNL